jgi:hypothetical protein
MDNKNGSRFNSIKLAKGSQKMAFIPCRHHHSNKKKERKGGGEGGGGERGEEGEKGRKGEEEGRERKKRGNTEGNRVGELKLLA